MVAEETIAFPEPLDHCRAAGLLADIEVIERGKDLRSHKPITRSSNPRMANIRSAIRNAMPWWSVPGMVPIPEGWGTFGWRSQPRRCVKAIHTLSTAKPTPQAMEP